VDSSEAVRRIAKYFHEQLRPYDPASTPQPPRLHVFWLLVLSVAFGYFTGAIFIDVWLVLQANWIRRASSRTLGLRLAVWSAVVECAGSICTLTARIPFLRAHLPTELAEGFKSYVELAMRGLYLGAIFAMRSDFEDEPIGMPIGGFMTLLFGPYYFQYRLQDYVFTRLRSPSLTGIPAISQSKD
jgi:hypothetical protein